MRCPEALGDFPPGSWARATPAGSPTRDEPAAHGTEALEITHTLVCPGSTAGAGSGTIEVPAGDRGISPIAALAERLGNTHVRWQQTSRNPACSAIYHPIRW